MMKKRNSFFLLFSLFILILAPVFGFVSTADASAAPTALMETSFDGLEAGYYQLLIHYQKEDHQERTASLYINDRFARKVVFGYLQEGTKTVPVYFPADDARVSLRLNEGDAPVELLSIQCEPRATETRMVIVPHEDDESLGFAGSIMHMAEEGHDVILVMVTNGDFGGTSIAPDRLLESADALECLGVPRENLIIMGYPDSGLTKLYEAGQSDGILSFEHGAPHTYAYPPNGLYDFHTLQTGAPAALTGRNIRDDFFNILAVHRPSEIYVTSQYDRHVDHAAVHRFVIETIRTMQATMDYGPLVHEGIVHGIGDYEWPERLVYDESGELLAVPFTPPFPEGMIPLRWEDRTILHLTEEMVLRKQGAIDMYFSQLQPGTWVFDYLYAYVKTDEFYWTTDYSR